MPSNNDSSIDVSAKGANYMTNLRTDSPQGIKVFDSGLSTFTTYENNYAPNTVTAWDKDKSVLIVDAQLKAQIDGIVRGMGPTIDTQEMVRLNYLVADVLDDRSINYSAPRPIQTNQR